MVTINVVHICTTTTIVPQLLSEVTVQLGEGEQVFDFEEFYDSVSLNDASESCGVRTYEIKKADGSPAPAFVSFDPLLRKITISTDDPVFVGVHDLIVSVELENYPGIDHSEPFKVTVLSDPSNPLIDSIANQLDDTSLPYFPSDALPSRNQFIGGVWLMTLPEPVAGDGAT